MKSEYTFDKADLINGEHIVIVFGDECLMQFTIKVRKKVEYFLQVIDDLLVRFELAINHSLQVLFDDRHFRLHSFKSIDSIIHNIE